MFLIISLKSSALQLPDRWSHSLAYIEGPFLQAFLSHTKKKPRIILHVLFKFESILSLLSNGDIFFNLYYRTCTIFMCSNFLLWIVLLCNRFHRSCLGHYYRSIMIFYLIHWYLGTYYSCWFGGHRKSSIWSLLQLISSTCNSSGLCAVYNYVFTNA